jgi:hypothetical protein
MKHIARPVLITTNTGIIFHAHHIVHALQTIAQGYRLREGVELSVQETKPLHGSRTYQSEPIEHMSGLRHGRCCDCSKAGPAYHDHGGRNKDGDRLAQTRCDQKASSSPMLRSLMDPASTAQFSEGDIWDTMQIERMLALYVTRYQDFSDLDVEERHKFQAVSSGLAISKTAIKTRSDWLERTLCGLNEEPGGITTWKGE